MDDDDLGYCTCSEPTFDDQWLHWIDVAQCGRCHRPPHNTLNID